MTDLYNRIESIATSDDELGLVRNLYMYLGYDQDEQFVVDLDNVWVYVGFESKVYTKKKLQRHFDLNTHYKSIQTHHISKASNTENIREYTRTKIFMTPNAFIDLCIVSNTSRANQVRKFYSAMIRVRNEYVKQEHKRLVEKLENLVKVVNETAVYNQCNTRG